MAIGIRGYGGHLELYRFCMVGFVAMFVCVCCTSQIFLPMYIIVSILIKKIGEGLRGGSLATEEQI